MVPNRIPITFALQILRTVRHSSPNVTYLAAAKGIVNRKLFFSLPSRPRLVRGGYFEGCEALSVCDL